MHSEVMPAQWWVQLVDSSPLEKHDELREAITGWISRLILLEGVSYRYDWGQGSPVPAALSLQGNDAPPDIYTFLGTIQQFIGRNEYMIFVVMVEADTLNKNALRHVIVTKNALAQVRTGEELLAKAKGVVLDADEEIEAKG